ncbi:MAG TPA: hydroxysqualene dehydroxylase HpnE [Rhizomicrobium sp.]|jgi:squalene-associated FAD-dependent desaturase|nr:hydroxysqualene dehydroxylase HpnE [Rhizomicrobium sp.]
MKTVHVIGAGLAGLSAATALAEKGVRVALYEAAPQAGGRCRSYFDPVLGQTIDNGNHFVLTGNHATMGYLRRIGAEQKLAGPEKPRTSFVDIRDGKRWTLAPSGGAIPFWLFDDKRRVPDTHASDYLEIVKLLFAGPRQRIGDVLSCKGALWERLLRPFFLGALNTQPEGASAALAGALVRETFARGGNAYRTRIAHPILAAAFVDPALEHLAVRGARVHFGERLRRVVFDGGIVTALEFPERVVPLAADDTLVLAVPPWSAQELIPKVAAPNAFCAIVNAHFKIAAPADAPLMLGVIGGVAEWIFSFPDRVSVTISGADRLVDQDRETLAALIWRDVAAALKLPPELPPWQIVKEKRATFAATPEQNAKRPAAATAWSNLFLAGDWTQTGLPATIEGAVRSGHKAADLA